MRQGFVQIRHESVAGTAEVSERSFHEYWSDKGWILVGEEPEPEESPSDEGEPANEIYSSEED